MSEFCLSMLGSSLAGKTGERNNATGYSPLNKKNGTEIEGIAFNIDVSEWLAAPLETIHALYRLDVNEYRGERRAQLVIQSFWPC